MGTTKLTRKEILAEDPVHQALIQTWQLLQERGKIIAIGAACLILLIVGIYLGMQYMESRDMQAQQQLAKAVDFFHAQIDPSALDDPYGKGPEPLFRTDAAKYQAAAKEFTAFLNRHGSSKLGVIARYYLGLTQLRLGQNKEAVQNLEIVRDNTKDRTLAYLSKNVLANYYLGAGNLKASQDLLEGMLKDPQCILPKEELKLELSRVIAAQGKHDEAVKLLREARMENGRSMLQGQIIQELNRLEGNPGMPPPGTLSPQGLNVKMQ